MSATSTSRGEGRADAPGGILVWDAPVRVFHWLTVLSFTGAYLTAESDRWRLLHVSLGYLLAGLVVFRLVWGLVGTRHARFANFVKGPAAVARYLRAMLRGQPEHHTGHNPAGALAIVAMLGLAVLITGSGWAVYNDVLGDRAEDLHEALANLMVAVVVVHIGGVVLASFLHRENLVRSMLTGTKAGLPQDSIRSAWRSVAALMLVAAVGFGVWQWQSAPGAAALDGRPTGVQDRSHGSDHDDD